MVINLAFFALIVISAIRTAAYGVYAFKSEGKVGGISVLVLAAASLATVPVVLFTQILR